MKTFRDWMLKIKFPEVKMIISLMIIKHRDYREQDFDIFISQNNEISPSITIH